MTEGPLDLAVVGSSLRGLAHARAAQRRGESVAVLERSAQPGGSARSRRREGFCCELGPFAFAAEEWREIAGAFDHPPPAIELAAAARTGWIWDGSELRPTPVEGAPCNGPTGSEDLVVAARRELGAALRLGHDVARVELPPEGPFELAIAGEVPRTVTTRRLALAQGLDAASRLAAAFDPALGDVAARLQTAPSAFVFFGSYADDASAAAWRGYGVLVDAESPVREVLFCSNAFARRAVAGKALVRVELGGPLLSATLGDAELLALAERELRAITGYGGAFLFARVDRTSELRHDGAYTECRVRLANVCARVPGLSWLR